MGITEWDWEEYGNKTRLKLTAVGESSGIEKDIANLPLISRYSVSAGRNRIS